ncbi:hypothetical protein RUM43_004858 [Polyplax serrata]|uniref:Uncharacterized protein n=1 Tax=Polyplax serrata TaxID=468196 RepID=A0AAN8SBA3_POLSC
MNNSTLSKSPFTRFEIHKVTTKDKSRHSDSPISSILKTPTAIFVTSRSSSTKRLKFANGPVELQSLKNGSNEVEVDSACQTPETHVANGNGEVISNANVIEVAISPVKTMKVSPESWEAFQEYMKYKDYSSETEKTDYTYSRLSKFRNREIIPGFLARPNLSRSSISSSRKSSLSSLPSNQSSFNESYLSYEFNVDTTPRSDFGYDHKLPDLITKSSRSKYNLRSSGLDDSDVSKINSKRNYSFGEISDTGKSNNKYSYSEKDYFSDSVEPEVVKRTIHYTTSTPGTRNASQVSSEYLTKVRSLDLDDDIDEVDDNLANHDKFHYGRTWLNNRAHEENSNVIGRFFTTVFLYLTTVGNHTRDLFSKYVLRRNDHMDHDGLRYSSSGGSGMSWTNNKVYMSPYYYADRYSGLNQNWYQRLGTYFSNKYSQLSNFLLGDRIGYASYSQHRDESRRKLWWWLLLPLLLLAGKHL